jgi:predicted nucleotidyltransferase
VPIIIAIGGSLMEQIRVGTALRAFAHPTRFGYIYPMRRQEAIARLKQVEPAVRGLGAASLYLFGSHARDEARPDSDVDVFIDKDPSRSFGFDEFMGIYLTLRKALGVEVGYTTREGLVEFYRPDIEREAIRVF